MTTSTAIIALPSGATAGENDGRPVDRALPQARTRTRLLARIEALTTEGLNAGVGLELEPKTRSPGVEARLAQMLLACLDHW
jgi:hypothetical protein